MSLLVSSVYQIESGLWQMPGRCMLHACSVGLDSFPILVTARHSLCFVHLNWPGMGTPPWMAMLPVRQEHFKVKLKTPSGFHQKLECKEGKRASSGLLVQAQAGNRMGPQPYHGVLGWASRHCPSTALLSPCICIMHCERSSSSGR